MPQTGNIYQTYDFGFGAGSKNREDLLDIVVNIAPWETPLFSTMPKTTCKHTTHEWIEDTLAAASAWGSGDIEGDNFSADTLLTRSRVANWTQIFRKDIMVSNTQRAVDPAGVRDEYAYQISVALKEIARSIETRMFASASGVSGAAGTPRTFKNLEQMIVTNTASASANSGVKKAAIDTAMQIAFTAGGTPSRLYVHPDTKAKLADELSSPTNAFNYRNIASRDNAVVGNLDVYFSNFGPVEVIPDRFIPTASATATGVASLGRMWLLEQPKIRFAFLRPIRHVPLPANGDATRGMVLGEGTVEIMAETAHVKVTNVLTN
jgi:hypothetical protein